jgi:hypothetical protein
MSKIDKTTWEGNGQTCFSLLKTKLIQTFKRGSSHFPKNTPHHKILEDVMVTKSDNSFSGNQPYQFRKEFIFSETYYIHKQREK